MSAPEAGARSELRARAEIVGPGIHGEVEFVQRRTDRNVPVPGVRVEARVEGLAPGVHGFHIHEDGTCGPPFTAAGGHFDPTHPGDVANAYHPWHLGELPNLVADRHGRAHLRHETSRITLSPGQLSVFDPPPANAGTPGSSVIVHPDPDAGEPGHAGGSRIACGVIHRDDD